MALNFLQALLSPGPGLDGSDVSAPGMNMPGAGMAPPPQPGISELPDVGNMLQNLNVQPGVTPDAAPVSDQPAAPRARRSILDTVGRLADVFAKVGGAEALYQPTLDGREDRALALGDHARTVDLDKLKLETARNTLSDAGRAKVSSAVKGVQAILAANPKADIATIFPLMAQRAGIPAEEAAGLTEQIVSNPGLLDGLAGMDSPNEKYSGAVVLSKGPDGKIHAFQPNLGGGAARDILPTGYEGNDPTLAVNTGGTTALVGKNSGTVGTTLTNTVKPDTIANNDTKITTTRMNNDTATKIAGMPARAKAPGATDAKASAEAAGILTTLDNIQSSFDKLHKLDALPGEGGTFGNVLGTIGRTGLGQRLGAITGTSPAAQERELLGKNLGNLQSSMLKSLPGAATRTKFEQEIQKKRLPDSTTMSYSTANTAIAQLRAEYQRALQPGYASDSGGTTKATRKLPPRIGAPAPAKRVPVGKPTVSNW